MCFNLPMATTESTKEQGMTRSEYAAYINRADVEGTARERKARERSALAMRVAVAFVTASEPVTPDDVQRSLEDLTGSQSILADAARMMAQSSDYTFGRFVSEVRSAVRTINAR